MSAQLPQVKMNMSLDDPPTVAEVEKATAALPSGKAPGSDAIPAEIYKAGGTRLAIKINELFKTVWSAEGVPHEVNNASTLHLYKRTDHWQFCDNHCGISFLSIAGKTLARVLLVHLEQGVLPVIQCGFRERRGTTDMIFAAWQLQEKCQEQHRHLYTATRFAARDSGR